MSWDPTFAWIDLVGFWHAAKEAADKRDAQKRGYETASYRNENPNFVGLLGEYVYGEITGRPVNLELLALGDGGFDFPSVDVKATPYKTGHLLHPAAAEKWAPYFTLVVIDMEQKIGRYCGYAEGETLRLSPSVVNYGFGPQRSLAQHELVRDLPPGY